MNTYKINQSITVRYRAVGSQTGIVDLYLIVTNPSGVDSSPALMTEISAGLYSVGFTPNVLGRWLVRTSSILYPENVYSQSYVIGNIENPADEINTKFGEVQTTPTANTLLGRSKDLWDKLVELFNPTNGTAKIKLWDGNLDVKTGYNKSLKVQTYGTPLFQDNFQNNTCSSILWNETIAGAGSKSVANTTLILSVTTANGDSILEKATAQNTIPWIVGSFRRFYCGIQFGTQYTNNVKEWGMISSNNLDGFFFRLDGSNLYFIIKKSGAETSINITAYKPNIDELHIYTIEFKGRQTCYAIIDDSVVYSSSGYVAIINDKHLFPFIKHYNTGIISFTPSNLILNSIAFIDEADVHKTILGCDEDGIPRCVHTSKDGRLLVSVIPFEYNSKSISEIVDISIPQNTDYWILNTTGSGIIDEIHIIMDSDKFLFKIEVDGSNYFDEQGADIKTQYRLGSSNLAVTSANVKNIESTDGKDLHWIIPISFSSTIKIGVRNNLENNKKLKGFIILYREKP